MIRITPALTDVFSTSSQLNSKLLLMSGFGIILNPISIVIPSLTESVSGKISSVPIINDNLGKTSSSSTLNPIWPEVIETATSFKLSKVVLIISSPSKLPNSTLAVIFSILASHAEDNVPSLFNEIVIGFPSDLKT